MQFSSTTEGLGRKLAANPKDRVGFSDYVTGGRVVFKDVVSWYYDETNCCSAPTTRLRTRTADRSSLHVKEKK